MRELDDANHICFGVEVGTGFISAITQTRRLAMCLHSIT